MRIGRSFWQGLRHRRTVLAALGAGGEAGMTALTLAVTTQLPEPRLQAVLLTLAEKGLVEPPPNPQSLVLGGRPAYRLVRST
jgi:DNA-binding IclR family transcriptional regulator